MDTSRVEGTATPQNAELRTVELAHRDALRVQDLKSYFLILFIFTSGLVERRHDPRQNPVTSRLARAGRPDERRACAGPTPSRNYSREARGLASTASRRCGLVKTPSPRPRQVQVQLQDAESAPNRMLKMSNIWITFLWKPGTFWRPAFVISSSIATWNSP